MIDRRNLLICAGLGALATTFRSLAQPAKVARIGILSARTRSTPSNPDPFFDAFVQGMRGLGYVEGKNLVIEWRFAEGQYERLPALAIELVQLKPEVIVTHATPAVHALKRATNSIPIVMTSVNTPVESGFAASLARPGGNITGLSLITTDLSPKQIELLQTMMPRLSRIAVLMNPGTSSHPAVLKSMQTAASPRGVEVVPVHAANPVEIERGFEKLAREGVQAALIAADSVYFAQRRQIAELVVKHRVATITISREWVEAGGLMSYGTNAADSYRRAASYVDKILKGAKPGDLPIEQPTRFHLVINRKTAAALGIRIPQEMIGRADEII